MLLRMVSSHPIRHGRIQFSSIPSKVSCKLLVCGGGAAGCSVAAKFANKLGSGECVLVEPSDTHYYQPMWTLVGGGVKTLEQSRRPMQSVVPKGVTWVQDSVAEFYPEENKIITTNLTEIIYDFMVVALGVELNYDVIPGLEIALQIKNSGVCTNYDPKYVKRTFRFIQEFKNGNAIFTFPNTAIKCAGAPQKACYISEDLLGRYGKRKKAKLKYYTPLPVIFPVKRYADSLWKVCKTKDIEVKLRKELIEVKPGSKEAVFKNLDNPTETFSETFEMLHVGPPMRAPTVLKRYSQLTDKDGFLSVEKETLQHTKFKNVFGIGDCTNLPTSKTAAAVSAQVGVLQHNLAVVLKDPHAELKAKYNGYTSCPLITSLSKCIMAEFDYDKQPLETFPFDQSKERYFSFLLKKDVMPVIYWHGLLKGYWDGPALCRKLFHLGLKK